MKKSLTILILVAAALFSCDGPKPSLPLTPDLVSKIKAYDLDNNGNSSDIRVDFLVQDNQNVEEYRIMIVPTSLSFAFNKDIAASIQPESYLEVLPQSFQVNYSLKRLPVGLLDVNGNPIINGNDYVAVLLVDGTDNQQISEFSGSFSLRDRHIYSGKYFYGFEKSCVFLLDNASEELNNSGDGDFFIDLNQFGTRLRGIMDCTNCDLKGAYLFFELDGLTITRYELQANYPCILPQYCVGVIDCSFVEFGSGTIIDDLVIEIVISRSEDCIRDCEGTVVFVRQG